MQIYEELVARGLIAQVTDEKEIRELVNCGQPSRRTFYGAVSDEAFADGWK